MSVLVELDGSKHVMRNWRYDVKEYEFEILDDIQWGEADYSFDLTRVFIHVPTQALYAANDSGCSCPSPFEDTLVGELTPITTLAELDLFVADRMTYTTPRSVDQYAFLRGNVDRHLRWAVSE